MKFHHHITRKYNEAKSAPLWKWIVVIFIIVAMPLFFTLVNIVQTQQAVAVDQVLTESTNTHN